MFQRLSVAICTLRHAIFCPSTARTFPNSAINETNPNGLNTTRKQSHLVLYQIFSLFTRMPSSGSESSTSEKQQKYSATNLQIAIGVLMVGASAGLTLYTRKTQSMLQQMEKVSKQAAVRQGPVKAGPPTKAEWDKIRPRLRDDDIL